MPYHCHLSHQQTQTFPPRFEFVLNSNQEERDTSHVCASGGPKAEAHIPHKELRNLLFSTLYYGIKLSLDMTVLPHSDV